MGNPRDDLVAKANELAARQRQNNGVLATDLLSRQSIPAAGHLPVGAGPRELDLLPPDQADGSMLTLDSHERLRMKWAPPETADFVYITFFGGGSATDGSGVYPAFDDLGFFTSKGDGLAFTTGDHFVLINKPGVYTVTTQILASAPAGFAFPDAEAFVATDVFGGFSIGSVTNIHGDEGFPFGNPTFFASDTFSETVEEADLPAQVSLIFRFACSTFQAACVFVQVKLRVQRMGPP